MGKVCLFVICMYCSIHHLSAQQEEQQTQPVQQPLVTQDDILGNMNVDYAKIKLPPLSVLYENARSTPSLQILEKEKQLQKKLLSKEKRNWLGFIQAGGSASYGYLRPHKCRGGRSLRSHPQGYNRLPRLPPVPAAVPCWDGCLQR